MATTAKERIIRKHKAKLEEKGIKVDKKPKKILITAALPYVNNIPHLGNLVPTISADAFARFLRLQGANVIFVCGTDEHGTTTETKAIEEGVTPQEITDKYFKIHKDIYEWFNCSFDCFGRTSSEANKEVAIDIFNKLDKNKYIAVREVEQTYCRKCEKFLADRYVEGKCPYCGYEEARGDQCERCSKLLNAIELVSPKCKVCGEEPEVRSSTHLFIDLLKLEPKLREWISRTSGHWTENARTMTNAWLKEGLRQRCITRDLKWGISVPKEGFENKVFYSWFDAPIGYIGITRECRNDWKDWWLKPDETRLVQFMGKDNIPFHSILFPGFLIGTGDNYTLVSDLSVNEYLNYEGGMFSKSRNVGVFGDDAIDSGVPADIWRYYILFNRPETGDYNFSWRDFQRKINNQLVATFGNLVNRTITFINKFLDGKIGRIDLNKLKLEDKDFIEKFREVERAITRNFCKVNLREAFRELMHLARLGNQYFQENEPWELIKEDKERASTVLALLANLVKDMSIALAPFMPDSAEKIWKQLNINEQQWSNFGQITLKTDHQIGEAEILFHKVDDGEVNKFVEKYGGKKVKSEPLSEEVSEPVKEKHLFPNLKVAKILEAKEHPDADKLAVLQIDLGTEKRQLVAGIKNHYNLEELPGKNIVVVTNLQPAKLRGVESNGMLLAGCKDDKIVLISAAESAPGDQVAPEGVEIGEEQITIDDFAKIKLVVEGKRVLHEGSMLKTEKEEVSCDIEDGARVQ